MRPCIRHATLLAGIAFAIGVMHCSSSDSSGSGGGFAGAGAGGKDGGTGFGGGGYGNMGGGVADAAGEPPPPPPEKEIESSFRAPVATGKFVWAANPDSGRVALVDAMTYEVTIAEAGNGPTYLAAVSDPKKPENNVAIVLNVKSHDATLFRVQASGGIAQKTLPTHTGANAWAVSPGGQLGRRVDRCQRVEGSRSRPMASRTSPCSRWTRARRARPS